jgi:hypothetical protein
VFGFFLPNYFERRVFSQPFELINAQNLVLNNLFNRLEIAMRRLITSFAQFFVFLVALIAILFTGNAQAALNSQASDGSYVNKVVHTTAVGSDCFYVNDFHYEVYYRKLPSTSTWTEYFSEYRYPNDFVLTRTDTGGTAGQTYDYYMVVKNSAGNVVCSGTSDRGWANNPPTATSAPLPGSSIGGGGVCVAASVTDPNASQPYTSSPDTFTYSIVSQPAIGSAYISSSYVCYNPPSTYLLDQSRNQSRRV